MSRIASTFQQLARTGRKALIPFFTAGDPDPATCVPLMNALVAGGANIIELGIPFSDPMADGPVIQRSSERALKHLADLSADRGVLGGYSHSRFQERVMGGVTRVMMTSMTVPVLMSH